MPSVKHPKRDGENHFAVLKTTMNERLPQLRYLTCRDNVLVVPWMPWVGNLTNHRNVGVVLRGIIMLREITRESTISSLNQAMELDWLPARSSVGNGWVGC